jgi:hypothetical protein
MPAFLLLTLTLLAVSGAIPAQAVWPLLASRPPVWHSQAAINDARSHGTIGDRYLSLAEAILLTNRDLDENALSAEEVAQLSGFGGDIAWAGIDAGLVPRITLERDLPVIRDTPHGFTISGSNGTPTLDLRDTRGLVVTSDFFDASNILLFGGEHGIQLSQNDTLFGTLLDRVQFEAQDVAGLRLTFAGAAANSRVQVAGCSFVGLPRAIVVDDLGTGRSGLLEFFDDTRIVDCALGIDMRLGIGGSLSIYANALEISGAVDAMRIRSLGTPRRTLLFEGRYLQFEGSGSAWTVEGDPTSRTVLAVQSSEFVSPTEALGIGRIGSHLDLRIEDCRLRGPIAVLGGTSGRILAENLRIGSGPVDLGSSGAPVLLRSSSLDGTVLAASGSAPVQVVDSLLRAGSVIGTSAAPVGLEDCFRLGTVVGPNVTELRPRSAPHLADFDAAPTAPRLGSVLTLAAEVPPGFDGFVVFGRALEYASVLPGGARLYADGRALAMLPSVIQGTASLPVPIPNVPALAGLELYFHLAVTPQPLGGGLGLPPGQRIRLR